MTLPLTLSWPVKAGPVLAALLLLVSCDQQVQLEVASTASKKLPKDVSIRISAEQVCSDTTFTDVNGKEMQGKRDCKNLNKACEQMGDTYCMMQDAKLYGILDENLTEKNVKKGVPFSGKRGKLLSDLSDCTSDGETDCIVPSDALSLSGATLAAKTVKDHVVAGVTGTFDPGFPDRRHVMANDTVNGKAGLIPQCGSDGQTSCRANAAYRAVALSELQPGSIRDTVTMGGVLGNYTGAYGNCSADGADRCVTTSAFVSLDKTTVNAARVRQSVRLAGVLGSLQSRPADCTVGVDVGCVTTTSFPAADYGRIIPRNIKNGVNLAGVSGQYPSAAHRLVTDSAQQDLTATNFASRMASAQSFEYWDAAGNRYSNSGDANLVKGNILTGIEIFGVTGELAGSPAVCSDSLSLACIATATHPAYTAGVLTAANIKTGETIGAIVGAYPSAAHPLQGASATADLNSSTFNAQLANAAEFEYFDAAGNRRTGNGSADLAASNIVSGTTLFGVAGSLTTRPGDCADGLLVGCVTSAAFPAYDPALLNEGVIKSGVTIGNVTGKYPSIGFPLADATAAVDLTQANFASRLTSATSFEYWDSAGQRYTGAGDALFTSSHLRKDMSIFGVTGNVTARAPSCTAGGAINCVATTSYPAYRKADLVPSVIKNGQTILSVTGTYPSASTPLEGSSAAVADLGNQTDLYNRLKSADSFEFFDSTGAKHSGSGSAALIGTNIADGKTIFDVAGAMVEQPANCAAEGATGCLATAQYPAFDAATLTAGVLKNGVALGGITGQYPSATFPLPGAGTMADLSSSQFNNQVSSAANYEFWDSAGNRHSKAVATTLAGSTILNGQSIFGVNGSASPSPAACAVGTTTSCVTSAAFPSYVPADFTAGIIKSGVTIAGTMGDYPSNTFKLPGASNTSDLTGGSIATRIKNSAAFEYWDGAGNRHQGVGTDKIQPHFIRTGVPIYGVTGVLVNAAGNTLQPKDIRHGVKIGNTTGTLKLNCRDTAASAGTDTRDDYNGGSSSLPGHAPWGAAHECRNVFVDRTADGACDNGSDTCIFEDTITKLRWRQFSGNGAQYTWDNARATCTGGWRIPSYKEVITAYTHGFREVYLASGSNNNKFPDNVTIWTATNSSFGSNKGSKAWTFNFRTLRSTDPLKTSSHRTLCVRK